MNKIITIGREFGSGGRELGRCRAKAPEHENMTASELKKHILTVDKNRAHYYEYFTGRTWGDRMNYDLCVNATNASVKELAHVFNTICWLHRAANILVWYGVTAFVHLARKCPAGGI